MILQKDLQGFSSGDNRAEYTRHCGWIDWSHATPDKEDLNSIWSGLPPGGGRRLETRVMRDKRGNCYDYFLVSVEPDTDALTRIKLEEYLFLVRKVDSSNQVIRQKFTSNDGYSTQVKEIEYSDVDWHYRCVALALYMFVSNKAEAAQRDSWIIEKKSKSGWSIEDLVSDLLAFYQKVDGISKEAVIAMAGGWANRDEAETASRRVLASNRPQPRTNAKNWFRAHLYNDCLGDLANGDLRHGWHDLPTAFTRIKPHPIGSHIGNDIIYGPVVLRNFTNWRWPETRKKCGTRSYGRSIRSKESGARGKAFRYKH